MGGESYSVTGARILGFGEVKKKANLLLVADLLTYTDAEVSCPIPKLESHSIAQVPEWKPSSS